MRLDQPFYRLPYTFSLHGAVNDGLLVAMLESLTPVGEPVAAHLNGTVMVCDGPYRSTMEVRMAIQSTEFPRPESRPKKPAWTSDSLVDSDWLVTLSDAVTRELDQALGQLRANPLPVHALRVEDFFLDACVQMMNDVRERLDHGVGFALLDRLGVERMSCDEATALYWLITSLLGRPVAQKWDGRMVYAVTDLGRPPGNGVRPDVTNAEQSFHLDNSYNVCPPDYVGLLCWRGAKAGGISRIASLHTAHERLRASDPSLLQRLYEDFVFDRQREHAPDDDMTIHRPVFSSSDNGFRARVTLEIIRQGYELENAQLDELGAAALEALYRELDAPRLHKEFLFEPGQIQFINNRWIAHKRTGFVDWPEPERRRHLVRLWVRDGGRAFYNG